MSETTQKPFLEVKDLKVHFPTDDGLVKSVDGLSFDLERGKTIGIVGESGSGKSVTSQAILGLHRRGKAKTSGQIVLDGEDLMTISNEKLRTLRGSKMAMIFQDPLSALHPYYTIGSQIVEAIQVHHDVDKNKARARALEMLDRVGIPNPQRRIDQYPYEFSGGMRQRAMIAMALVNDPKLLIADEPTTALDVTVQAQILDLLNDLQKEFGSAIMLITHDLGVVAEVADDVLVMYAGRAVEYGTSQEVLAAPTHPYTWGLLESIPSVSAEAEMLRPIRGNPPSLVNLPSGCSFHPRCPYVDRVQGNLCRTELPELLRRDSNGTDASRCHLADPEAIFKAEVEPGLA